MRKINKNNKKAFTLVEIVLVVAIIVIIGVASIVGINLYIDRANSSADQKEEHSMKVDILIEDIKSFLRVGSLEDLRGSSGPAPTDDNNIIDNLPPQAPSTPTEPSAAPSQPSAEPTAAPAEPTAAPTQPTTAPTQAPAGGNGGSGGTYSGSAMAGTSTQTWGGGANVCLGGNWQTPTITSVTVAAPAGTTFTGVGNVTDNGDGTYTFSGSTYSQYSFGLGYSTSDGSQLNSSNFYVVDWH